MPGASVADYLSVEELAQFPELELRARFLVEGCLNGLHQSPFQGCNVEFKEHREYSHGDEFRNIDWNVYARTDRLYMRLREDETNLSAVLLLDRSASMDFQGTRAKISKYAFAQACAAALMLFLRRQGDAFTLGLVGNRMPELDAPSASEVQFQRMLAELSAPADSGDCRWEMTLPHLARVLKSHSIAVLFSDFYTEPETLAPLLDFIRRRNCEILLFHVFDPDERDLFADDSVLLQDAESLEKMIVTPELLREDYQNLFRSHQTALSELVAKFGGDYAPLCTERPPLELLAAWLRRREKAGWRR